jgi:hypothetical protein
MSSKEGMEKGRVISEDTDLQVCAIYKIGVVEQNSVADLFCCLPEDSLASKF